MGSISSTLKIVPLWCLSELHCRGLFVTLTSAGHSQNRTGSVWMINSICFGPVDHSNSPTVAVFIQTSCCTHNLRKTPQPLHGDAFSYPANVFTVVILTIGIFRYPSTNSLLSSQLESGPGTIAQQTNCCLLGINDWPCMIYPSSMGHLKQTPEGFRAAIHPPSDSNVRSEHLNTWS